MEINTLNKRDDRVEHTTKLATIRSQKNAGKATYDGMGSCCIWAVVRKLPLVENCSTTASRDVERVEIDFD